jgi:acyl transferase domain-containing protein
MCIHSPTLLIHSASLVHRYMAPSAHAQAVAVVGALTEAGLSAEDISYVECHATATLLGDGIEISGLADAFAATSAHVAVAAAAAAQKAAESREEAGAPVGKAIPNADVSGTGAGKDDAATKAMSVADATDVRGNPNAIAGAKKKTEPWCALGSIKGNIAHANCAAGVTGLIKALMCLHHKELVPTAHYENANPKLGLEYVRS